MLMVPDQEDSVFFIKKVVRDLLIKKTLADFRTRFNQKNSNKNKANEPGYGSC